MISRIAVIARREFIAAVANKAFIIGVFLMPVMIGLSVWIPTVAERFKSDKVRVVAIIDRTPPPQTGAIRAMEALKQLVQRENGKDPVGKLDFEEAKPGADETTILELKFELAERVRAGKLAAFFEINPGRDKDPGQLAYYSGAAFDKDMLTSVAARLAAINQLQRSAPSNPLLWARAEKRYKADELAQMLFAGSKAQDNLLVQRELPTRDSSGQVVDGKVVESVFRALVPVFAVILMFMAVMVGGSPQLNGVLEEKMNRIGEVLLGSAMPMEILCGKLVGMSLTGLVLSSIYLGGGLLVGRNQGFLPEIRPEIPLWFLLFQVLALLMFGSLFIAVGSACSDLKQAQTMLTPVTLTASLPMLLMLPVIEDPNGNLARVVSLFPPATPMLMLARIAAGAQLAWWEPVLGALLVLVTTLGTLWVAARIFQNGYLHQGQAPSLRLLLSWLARRN
jgi:ABC-type Na+ efflux pump permease subunit